MSPRRATLVWITDLVAGSGSKCVAGRSFYYRTRRGLFASTPPVGHRSPPSRGPGAGLSEGYL
jgi:hypothetical protein